MKPAVRLLDFGAEQQHVLHIRLANWKMIKLAFAWVSMTPLHHESSIMHPHCKHMCSLLLVMLSQSVCVCGECVLAFANDDDLAFSGLQTAVVAFVSVLSINYKPCIISVYAAPPLCVCGHSVLTSLAQLQASHTFAVASRAPNKQDKRRKKIKR